MQARFVSGCRSGACWTWRPWTRSSSPTRRTCSPSPSSLNTRPFAAASTPQSPPYRSPGARLQSNHPTHPPTLEAQRHQPVLRGHSMMMQELVKYAEKVQYPEGELAPWQNEDLIACVFPLCPPCVALVEHLSRERERASIFGFVLYVAGTGRCLPSCRCSWPTPCVGAHSTADGTWRRPSPKSTASRSTSTSYAASFSFAPCPLCCCKQHPSPTTTTTTTRVIAAELVGRDGGGAGEFGLRPGQRQLDPAHR